MGIPSIPVAFPGVRDLIAETISDLLGRVCGMHLAGEIVSVVEGKGGTSFDTT